jgi:hypothetical protein
VRTALSAGTPARLVAPFSESFRVGLKPRAPQAPTWKRFFSCGVWPTVEVSEPVISLASQLEGLRVKFDRFSCRAMLLTSSGTPSRIEGIWAGYSFT